MSKAARERTARERLAEERKRQAAKEKRTRALLVGVAAVVVIAVVVVAAVIIQNNKGKENKVGYQGALAPTSVQPDGAVVMAQPNATGAAVDLYEDFQCPICKEFEGKSGDVLKKLAAQGKIKVTYHVLAFVNPEGSTRAAVAGKCAADEGKFVQFHDVAYRKQPDEREALTVDQLKKFGKDAGIGGKYDSCVAGQQFAGQVKQNTEAGLKLLQEKLGRQAGTPSMLVNGKPVSQNAMFDPQGLERELLAAAPASPGAPSPSTSSKKAKS
ncbi:DsbA family protein [Actinomadura macrotermitis]|uniref:Thioredoxin-like fold domain-containing protein n=1 Tax=Actinomadura macrotermitis TaxID=2585200 RepID=A0A7K0BM70_9ACTN|nr:thioredoxin domain-containing protein [Actinomadura macrotermitis]MQY02265.1 hypothetical protein [Actinomadura macrotermitis]